MTPIILISLSIGLGILAMYLIRRAMKSKFISSRLPPRYLPIVESAFRWVIVLIVLIAVLSAMGLTASTVIASISAFSLVAAVAFFAYWSVLSNGLCSLLLLLFQPFRVGDRIEVRENENNLVADGTVSGINLIYVTLEIDSPDGVSSQYRIPTNLLFQRTIRVWHGEDTKSLGQVYAEDNLNIESKD